MARTHARAPRGQRAYDSISLSFWQRLWAIGALACEGLVATISRGIHLDFRAAGLSRAGADGQTLGVKPDAALAMDNLRSHLVI